MTEKNELFPNALEAFFIVAALSGIEFLLSATAYDMRDFLGLPSMDLNAIVMVLGSGVLFTFVMHHKALSYRALFHSSPSSMSATGVVLMPVIALTIPALILVVSLLISAVTSLVPLSAAEEAMFAAMESGSLATILYGCLIAPVLEEMLFRGIILRSFLMQYGRWAAIAGSAALFGLAHLNIYQFVGGMLCGLYLGWLYERTNSLIPCIGLHVAYNTTLIYFATAAPAGDEASTTSWVLAIVVGACGAWLLQRLLIGRVARA